VALGAENQRELEQIAARLEQHGVPFHRVVESHGKYAGQLMALGVAPGPKSVRGKHLSNIQLLSMGSFLEFIQRQEETLKEHRKRSQVLHDRIHELETALQEAKRPWWKRWINQSGQNEQKQS